MADTARPYTDAQLAGIEAIAALADQDTTVPRLMANIAQLRAERDALRASARAFVDQVAEQVALDLCDRCEALATRELTTMRHVHNLCDAHVAEFWETYASGDAVVDLPHAGALRALMALLPPDDGGTPRTPGGGFVSVGGVVQPDGAPINPGALRHHDDGRITPVATGGVWPKDKP